MPEKKVITDLEALVERLMADHDKLAALCSATTAERDALVRENRDLQQRTKALEKELAAARLREGLAGNTTDQSKAIARVNRLMREVDKCIALLNKPEQSAQERVG